MKERSIKNIISKIFIEICFIFDTTLEKHFGGAVPGPLTTTAALRGRGGGGGGPDGGECSCTSHLSSGEHNNVVD
jgi:hypothetical protein